MVVCKSVWIYTGKVINHKREWEFTLVERMRGEIRRWFVEIPRGQKKRCCKTNVAYW